MKIRYVTLLAASAGSEKEAEKSLLSLNIRLST